jgi:hypothetical protein
VPYPLLLAVLNRFSSFHLLIFCSSVRVYVGKIRNCPVSGGEDKLWHIKWLTITSSVIPDLKRADETLTIIVADECQRVDRYRIGMHSLRMKVCRLRFYTREQRTLSGANTYTEVYFFFIARVLKFLLPIKLCR